MWEGAYQENRWKSSTSVDKHSTGKSPYRRKGPKF